MAEHIVMIALSPTMEQGQIQSWNKQEGDTIAAGDVLCEVETDKAVMEYESTQEGTLLKIVAEEGASIRVGEPIAIIGEEGESIEELQKPPAPEKPEPPSAEPESRPETPAAEPSSAEETRSAQENKSGRVKASPLARKLAARKGLNLAELSGSGPGGRVIKRDVEGAAQQGSRMVYLPLSKTEETEIVPVSGMRALIAERLSQSKFSAPHYYLTLSVNTEKLLESRGELRETLGRKISYNAFLMKLIAEALKRNRRVNASWQGDKIIQFSSIDMGLAVALEDGLITPVVRHCERKGIREIDEELESLIDRARSGALKPEEYSGATFTLSNLGSFGIEEFTAIINPPAAAILAVGKVQKTLVADENGDIKTEPFMKMTLSCDHRVIDGAVGARFMRDLKVIVENPINALL